MTNVDTYALEPTLIEAAKHGELIVFVGAGASMLCGSPDWRGFANKVVDTLEGHGVLRFLEAEQLRGLGDARRTLSVAMELAKKKEIAINYDEILHPSVPHPEGLELYKLLAKLRPVFVTTNYDKWLDEIHVDELPMAGSSAKEFEFAKLPGARKSYFDKEQFSSALLLEREAVIHLHGSYMQPDSMVVSLKDYILHYSHSGVRELIQEMFRKYTVLFVGYGLAELEILENIVRYNPYLRNQDTEPQHFLLYGCRSTEHVQTDFISGFFLNQCGVKVIPYRLDDCGYVEVLNVFRTWSDELVVSAPTVLDLQIIIDGYVQDANPTKRQAAIALVKQNPDLKPYLLKTATSIEWFDDFDAAGLLL